MKNIWRKNDKNRREKNIYVKKTIIRAMVFFLVVAFNILSVKTVDAKMIIGGSSQAKCHSMGGCKYGDRESAQVLVTRFFGHIKCLCK